MASTAYLSGHDFYALKRRASKPGSADAVSPTGVLNYDAWILEGLETLDANVRALGVIMTSTEEELGAVDSDITPLVVRTDGRGRLQPGFRKNGSEGWIIEAAYSVDERARTYASNLSSAKDLREVESSFQSFDEQFLSYLETIDHNLRAWFGAVAPEASSDAGLVCVPQRAASPPFVRNWNTWHLSAIEIINANAIEFAIAYCPADLDVAPPRAAGSPACCVVS